LPTLARSVCPSCGMRSKVPPPLPEHLFEQADGLTAAVESRPTDLRRAISNAYYGLFHFP
jgi:hypothetical protein